MGLENACILDNGAYTVKVGLSSDENPKIIPNCIMKAKSERRRAFIGSQIEECRDASGLFFILCFQKGYLLNWDVQKTVWDHMFSPEGTGINLAEKTLIVTEPQFNFESNQEAMTEIFFEEFECDAMVRTTAADLAAFNYINSKENCTTCIVIDMGYSFTHVIPFIKGKRNKMGIRRLDVGGKVLTNHLKELISYRHINVMDESYVVNQIKEDICFVSQNFKEDMKAQLERKNSIAQEYILPDFTSIKRGYVKKEGEKSQDHQILKLNNERFTIPEVFFNPSDIGIKQIGIPELVIDCLKDCPNYTHDVLLSNIVVIGGSSLLPGMQTRLLSEIRALAPDDLNVHVILTENPISYAWQGGKLFYASSDFKTKKLTRSEYEENGVQISLSKFDL